MKIERAKDLYPLMDKFIEEFLFNGNSIFSTHTAILSKENLDHCFSSFVENFDESNKSFDEKVRKQFENATLQTKLLFAHAEWLWAFAVDDIKESTKYYYIKRTTGLSQDEIDKNSIPNGFGSAGQWHTNNKYNEILFNLNIIRFIYNKIEKNEIKKDISEVKKWIEAICLYNKYSAENNDYLLDDEIKNLINKKQYAQSNILLYVMFPDNYERIASNNHKQQILSAFWGLLSDEDKKLNTDKRIKIIREEIVKSNNLESFDFYESKYRKIWNYSLYEEGFSEIQGLQYKKAIILYGPPGTSKTHSATQLARALINYECLKERENVVKYIKEAKDFTENRIHHLQLHPNYNYEDFIAGYQLEDNKTVKREGTFLRICKEAEKDNKPHVLILDEINRIDLSRLFGEVFSAIENRSKSIELGIGELTINVPDNLYIIGTMNEIDFSLERIDFALRRRFLWFFYGFNQYTLQNIINSKIKKSKIKLDNDKEINRFINNALLLNQKISSIPELGKQFQIGHTFFAEIVDIYQSYYEIGGYSGTLTKQIYRGGDDAAKILWDISLKPMITSFLGNSDVELSKEILAELYNLYKK